MNIAFAAAAADRSFAASRSRPFDQQENVIVIVNNPPAELAGRVWMLGTGAYPIYLIRGQDHGLLVEGGISALGPVLRRQLAAMAVKDGYISQAVITHAHPDHVMAVPALRALFPGLIVSSSAAAAEVLNSEKALAFFEQIDQSLTEALSRRGETIDAAESPPDCSSIRVDRILHDGDTIAVDDMQWSVLATPGHSACSISLFEPQARVLIISDASGYYLPEHRYWWPNYFADFGQYVASLERLAALAPKYIAELPKDRYSDGQIKYRQEKDGYVLYSVGPNLKDDGGLSVSVWGREKAPGDGQRGSELPDDVGFRVPLPPQ